MIRALAFAAVCLGALPAMAQTPPDPSRAIEALSAIWRPLAAADLASSEAAQTACSGALEEMAAIDAAMPPVISAESLSRVRALRGFLVITGENEPGTAFFFPNTEMPWFASGLGAIAVLSEPDGLIGVRDAAGQNHSLQLGRAGGRPVMRIRAPEGAVLTFVGCAASGG
jgi:hypothetical protein